MGILLNPSSDLYQRALRSAIYVDKTGMLKVTNRLLGTENQFLCISRPRRFGKTMAMNMMSAYYGKGCDSRELFLPYEISRDESFETHLNQYHVIQINMRDCITEADSIHEMLAILEEDIKDELEEELQEVEVPKKRSLIKCLEKAYAKTKVPFVFLIDEWDAVFRVKGIRTEEQKEYLDFLRNLLKDKAYVCLAYMTGILPIKKYGEHSALNMFTEYSMTEAVPLSSYTGFTIEEVMDLCKEYDVPYDTMQMWYDGYLVDGLELYNPRSVVQACMKKKFDSYWTQTETFEALKVYIEMNFDGLRDKVIRMIAGERVPVNTKKFSNDMTTFKSVDDVLTLLIHLGYLTYDFDEKTVWIPNSEVQQEFINSIEDGGWEEVMTAILSSDALLGATLAGEEEKAAEILERIHQSETSIMAYNDENALASVISIAYYSARRSYEIYRELPSGKGYADMTFVPRKKEAVPAMVVELKLDKAADTALSQIYERRYPEGLKGYKGEVVLVGISYDRKEKKHSCKIERIWMDR